MSYGQEIGGWDREIFTIPYALRATIAGGCAGFSTIPHALRAINLRAGGMSLQYRMPSEQYYAGGVMVL